MLFINKKESVKYQAQIAKIDADILGARKLITAKVKSYRPKSASWKAARYS